MCPYTLLYPPSRHPSFSFTGDSSKDQSLGGFAYGKYGEPGNFGTGYWGRKILGGMTASYPAFLDVKTDVTKWRSILQNPNEMTLS